ncbi:MAG: glycerophosphodiester phosphodiesterase [Candidatus Hydrogenedentota bacterium]
MNIFWRSALVCLGLLGAGAAVAAAEEAVEKPIVIAHRGASGYLPEHTLEAYAMAHALGADYIEPDLVMTKDGRFVCMHDIHLKDTTNVEEVFPERKREDDKWYAADFTLEEIKQLSVHERLPFRFPEGAASFRVPTFEEMIELVQGLNKTTKRVVGIYPELKAPAWHRSQGLAMEEAFLEVAKQYGYEGKDAPVFVQCFEEATLKRMRLELGSELPQIMLIGGGKSSAALLTPEGLETIAAFAEGIGPAKSVIDENPGIVAEAHKRNLDVHPYTFRAEFPGKGYESVEEELARFFFEYGVDGVFTDFADIAVHVRTHNAP